MRTVEKNKRLDTYQPVRLTEAEREALGKLAVLNERTRGAEIRMALRAWFAQNGVTLGAD